MVTGLIIKESFLLTNGTYLTLSVGYVLKEGLIISVFYLFMLLYLIIFRQCYNETQPDNC